MKTVIRPQLPAMSMPHYDSGQFDETPLYDLWLIYRKLRITMDAPNNETRSREVAAHLRTARSKRTTWSGTSEVSARKLIDAALEAWA